MLVLDKNCKVALSNQLSDLLLAGIHQGIYSAGSRLPSERRLMEQYKVSRNTVIEALNILEHNNFIERVSTKGTFVAGDVNHNLKMMKIVFPFPEVSLSPVNLGRLENWYNVSEMYRGLVNEAAHQNAEIHFMHFPEVEDEMQLMRQIRKLERFDAMVFVGWQLRKLHNHFLGAGKFTVLIRTPFETPAPYTVELDDKLAFSELARLAAGKHYRKLTILTPHNPEPANPDGFKIRTQLAQEAFQQEGFEANDSSVYYHEKSNAGDLKKILDHYKLDGTEIIFVLRANLVPQIYKYCRENNIRPGKDIGIFSYSSGRDFVNLEPEVTYARVNAYGLGRQACRRLLRGLHEKDWHPGADFVKNEIVTGESL